MSKGQREQKEEHEWPFFFFRRVMPTSLCWEWQGELGATGYAYHMWKHTKYLAHRFIYEKLVGPIPPGFEIHHMCTNRKCVNPCHLVPKIHKDHLSGWSLENSKRKHCVNGHPFTKKNTYIRKNGSRQCILCLRIRTARYLARRKANSGDTSISLSGRK